MKSASKAIWTIALLVYLAVAACEGIGTTSIGRILDKPREYADTKVTVAGEVTDSFSLLVIKYFIIQDETGQITVVSNKALPKKGTTVRVTGMVREAFSIGDQQLLVLVEEGAK